jgi:hypothetical protein
MSLPLYNPGEAKHEPVPVGTRPASEITGSVRG